MESPENFSRQTLRSALTTFSANQHKRVARKEKRLKIDSAKSRRCEFSAFENIFLSSKWQRVKNATGKLYLLN
jgi:hypothetical protein